MALPVVFQDLSELKRWLSESEILEEVKQEFLEFYELSTELGGTPCKVHFQFKSIEPDPSKRK